MSEERQLGVDLFNGTWSLLEACRRSPKVAREQNLVGKEVQRELELCQRS